MYLFWLPFSRAPPDLRLPRHKSKKNKNKSRPYPSEVAGGLEVDEVVLGGIQRAVPVAVVGVVVAHGEGRGLGQAAGGQLGRVVVRRPSGLRLAVGLRGGEAVGGAQLPPPHLAGPVLLHHHHLVGTAGGERGWSVERQTVIMLRRLMNINDLTALVRPPSHCFFSSSVATFPKHNVM